MRSIAILPLALTTALGLAAQPAPAQASRVVCVVNDTGYITRARAEHGAGYGQHTSWDRMAAAQRACFNGVTGDLRLRVEFWDFGWKPVCTRVVRAADSKLLSIKDRSLSPYCQ